MTNTRAAIVAEYARLVERQAQIRKQPAHTARAACDVTVQLARVEGGMWALEELADRLGYPRIVVGTSGPQAR